VIAPSPRLRDRRSLSSGTPGSSGRVEFPPRRGVCPDAGTPSPACTSRPHSPPELQFVDADANCSACSDAECRHRQGGSTTNTSSVRSLPAPMPTGPLLYRTQPRGQAMTAMTRSATVVHSLLAARRASRGATTGRPWGTAPPPASPARDMRTPPGWVQEYEVGGAPGRFPP